MKKNILFVVCLLSMAFFACAKSQQPVADVDVEVKEVIPAPAETETVLSPQTAELEKLQKAFALLPEKTKAGITNGDPRNSLRIYTEYWKLIQKICLSLQISSIFCLQTMFQKI